MGHRLRIGVWLLDIIVIDGFYIFRFETTE
jgi:hypothetical protein